MKLRKAGEMLGIVSRMSGPHGFAPRAREIPMHEQPSGLAEVRAWLVACDQDDPQLAMDTLTPTEVAAFVDAPAGYVCCLASLDRDRRPFAAL